MAQGSLFTGSLPYGVASVCRWLVLVLVVVPQSDAMANLLYDDRMRWEYRVLIVKTPTDDVSETPPAGDLSDISEMPWEAERKSFDFPWQLWGPSEDFEQNWTRRMGGMRHYFRKPFADYS